MQQIFDRQAKRLQRERSTSRFSKHDFLIEEVTDRVFERLADMSRPFPALLDCGVRSGLAAKHYQILQGIEHITLSDNAYGFIAQHPVTASGRRVVMDEEYNCFRPSSFDLIINILNLQWVNDLPGALIQLRQNLKSDGVFIAVIWGGETLKELRQAVIHASVGNNTGVSPRVSPFVDVKDAGALLQRAGFALPVADSEVITVSYSSPQQLFEDLRGMGESNALIERQTHLTSRGSLSHIVEAYQELFADEEGRIPATFELVTLTGVEGSASG